MFRRTPGSGGVGIFCARNVDDLTPVLKLDQACSGAGAGGLVPPKRRGKLVRIGVLEEGRDRSRRPCDNDDRPQLKSDVKRTASRSDRVF
jgi:hypothetical protein